MVPMSSLPLRDLRKTNHIVTRRQKKRNLRVGYAQHLEGGQKPKFDRNGPGKVVALEEPREEKKKRKDKKRKEKKRKVVKVCSQSGQKGKVLTDTAVK